MNDPNENRKGYKPSKVGWIPIEWDTASAGKLCSSITKGTTPKERGQESLVDPIPFLRVQNLTFDGSLNFTRDRLFVERARHESELKRSKLRPGDVLINIVGPPLGKVSQVTDDFPEWNMNQAIAVYRLQTGYNTKFFSFFLQSRRARSWLDAQAKKTSGQKNLTLEICQALPVPIPPQLEQRHIAEVLTTWNRAIEKMEDLIQEKQRRKKALMQQLLTGKTRFKEFESHPRWKLRPLDSIFERVKRVVGSKTCEVLSITAGVGFESQQEKFGRVIAGRNYERYIRLKRGEFAYNKGNSKTYTHKCVYLLEEYEEGAVPNVFFCFRPRSPDVNLNFYKFYFEAGLLDSGLRRVINTGVRNDGLLNLYAHDFFQVKVPQPPLSEQGRIAGVISAQAEEIHRDCETLEALQHQKKGLMQKLLTGQVRVTHLIDAEASA